VAASPTTLTPELLEERVAVAFLERFVADAAAGRHRPLAHWLATFPQHEARIAREWLQLTGHVLAPVTAAPAPAERAERVGPYRLQSELGRGAQGIVYLAEDTRLHRSVALKVLPRDVVALSGPATLRLRREAEAIARLEHPGIATIYETGQDDAMAWIAMQYVAGGSVQQRIARRVADGLGPPGPDAIPAVVRLVERAARALAAAHAAGILHRDVKPANLLLKADDEPVLVDFGLAADEHASTPTITAPGAVFGTLAYLPPERLGGAPADARSDVYSLGAVLFELLALTRPYAAEVTAHELKAIAEAAVPDVRVHNPSVPRDLATVVATALAKSPVDRYASATAFADDLARVLALQPIAARPASTALRLRRWAQRNPRLAQSLFALVVVVAVGLVATTWLWRESEHALGDVRRLADLKLARELVAGADDLWPARPERLPAMQTWRRELDTLRERLPDHRRRQGELPPAGQDPTSDWEAEQLALLLAAHDRLDALATDVDRRTTTASGLAARTVDGPAAAWRDASARVAADPRFQGLQLRPQLGLVPLGPDPRSRLEEFAHVLSGTPPVRDATTGALRLDDDSAIVLVLIPGGRSLLGADREPPADGRPANVDPDTPKEQEPSYVVDLAPYFLSRFEMTQAQWQLHTGKNPSTYHVGGGLTKIDSVRHPVELVTWEECDLALRQLDLVFPTEAQWEHAYRAGTGTPIPYGPDPQSLRGHENLADATARERGTNRRLRFIDWLDDGWFVHAPVGSFLPNAFGLHDMGGNVKEWCDDSWEDYPTVEPRAGDGRRRGKYDEYRIVRGGSFSSWIDDARAAARGGVQKNTSGAEAGVRPARRIE